MNVKDLLKITKIKKLPFEPADLSKDYDGGIYRFYNLAKEIIYVGKSQDLKRRLKQHLGKDTNTAYFIDEVVFIEVLQEPNPIFQTMLEGIHIALHQPKYNDEVKDWSEIING